MDERSPLSGDSARQRAAECDLGDIRVFETGLANVNSQYPASNTSDQKKETRLMPTLHFGGSASKFSTANRPIDI